jgi:hypothetical protein
MTPPSFNARLLAFAIVRTAAAKHGTERYVRATRFAKKCAAKSVRLGKGRKMWDEVIAALTV